MAALRGQAAGKEQSQALTEAQAQAKLRIIST